MFERLAAFLHVEREEAPAVAAGAAMFFLLFAGYFMLRPVRETMGIAGGVDNLQWLFTATFVATIIALPLFGWIASKAPRRRILPWTYAFFVANLIAFAIAFVRSPDDVWSARAFYVWLSVFNLLAISLAWSVLVDLLPISQAKRLFALIAAGASLGGLAGPILGQAPRASPLGGNIFAGATAVVRSGYLAAIAAFVVLLAVVSTFLYFEQARLVAETFPDKTRQTQVFGLIDAIVQALTILIQVFLTGRIAERFGVVALLAGVPLAMAAGFLWLALAPVFAVLAIVMVARRVGEYALVRPDREMLFTVVASEEKYKAKNFIDTVVYRGGDAFGGWVKRGLDLLAEQPSLAMVLGAAIALVWGAAGVYLGTRLHRQNAGLTGEP